MEDPRDDSKPTAGVTPGQPARLDRRRLLIRGGAAAAPVVLTLASQPVSATGLIGCTKASGFVSMNTFASQQPGVNFIQCTSNGVSWWRQQAKTWSSGSATHAYRRELNKTVQSFFGKTSCTNGTTRVGTVMKDWAASSSGSSGVLQRLLALGLSISYGMVPNPNNISCAYLGDIWVNFNSNSQKYMTGVPNESMDAAQLIRWLDLLTTATPIVNTAP